MWVATSSEDPFRWDCQVREGQVTRHDLDLRDRVPVALQGQLLLGGRPAVGWTADFQLTNYRRMHGEPLTCTLDQDGRFQLDLPPDDYDLELRSPKGQTLEFTIYRQLTLEPGPRSWSLDLPIGSLAGIAPQDATCLEVSQGSPRGGNWERAILPVEGGEAFEMGPVPAGEVGFGVATGDSRQLRFETRRQLTVPAGGSASLEDR